MRPDELPFTEPLPGPYTATGRRRKPANGRHTGRELRPARPATTARWTARRTSRQAGVAPRNWVDTPALHVTSVVDAPQPFVGRALLPRHPVHLPVGAIALRNDQLLRMWPDGYMRPSGEETSPTGVARALDRPIVAALAETAAAEDEPDRDRLQEQVALWLGSTLASHLHRPDAAAASERRPRHDLVCRWPDGEEAA